MQNLSVESIKDSYPTGIVTTVVTRCKIITPCPYVQSLYLLPSLLIPPLSSLRPSITLPSSHCFPHFTHHPSLSYPTHQPLTTSHPHNFHILCPFWILPTHSIPQACWNLEIRHNLRIPKFHSPLQTFLFNAEFLFLPIISLYVTWLPTLEASGVTNPSWNLSINHHFYTLISSHMSSTQTHNLCLDTWLPSLTAVSSKDYWAFRFPSQIQGLYPSTFSAFILDWSIFFSLLPDLCI